MRYINPKAIPAPNRPGWYLYPNFPNYAISEDGQIWSYTTNKLLKLVPDTDKYLIVTLCNKGHSRMFKVHRLVGWVFVKLPEEFNGNYLTATINHKDHNRQNNHYTNLEWLTASCNSQEAWDNGYLDCNKRPCFVIDTTTKQYLEFSSGAEASNHFGLPEGTVNTGIAQRNNLIYGKYICGFLDDISWKETLSKHTTDEIIGFYSKQIDDYRYSPPKPCFCIDSVNKTCDYFNNTFEADRHFGFPEGTIGQAINYRDGLVYGRYITGSLEDPVWKERLKTLDVDKIIAFYSDRIANYKPTGPKQCFCIDIENKTRTIYNSAVDIDRALQLSSNATMNAINRSNGIIQGKYIVGAVDDPKWKEVLSNSTIEDIIKSYADLLEEYKITKGPKRVTDLRTGKSGIYKSLAEFARDAGLHPYRISRYLKRHPDLYKVEPV